jgi:sulfate transport system ATP-binding protein
VLDQPAEGSVPAKVLRVVRLGFEVRIDALVDGVEVWAQVTRDHARRLALRPGDTVHVRANHRPSHALTA